MSAAKGTKPAAKHDYRNLRSLVDQYCQKYGTSQPERGLEFLSAHVFALEDGLDALLEGNETEDADLAQFVLPRNDLGVDVVLEDEENKRIVLVQCTWRREVPEDKITGFFSIVDRLRNPEFISQGGTQAQELLGAFPEKIKDGWDVSLRFVTNAKVGDKERLQKIEQSANDAYIKSKQSVTCELLGETEFLNKYEELRNSSGGAAVPEASFKVQREKFIVLDEPEMPKKTFLGLVKASELVALYNRKDVRNKLFNLNIRLPLASKRINPGIQQTASDPDEGPNFFYYNNGISAVCSSFKVSDTEVEARRLQVINGAQTISSLVNAKKVGKLQSSTYVLVRLTETGENYGGSFTEKIIAYNNTQNPVKASDFFSNDPLQKWLATGLAAYSGRGPVPSFDYIHKSGARPKRGHKSLKIDELANIRHAFLYGPCVSYREPKSFFQLAPDGRYEEAFGIDGLRVESWSEEELAKFSVAYAVTRRVQELGRTLKANEKTKTTAEAKYLYRSARYVAALVAVGLREAQADGFKDYVTLAGSKPNFEKYIAPLLTKARDLVDSAIGPRYEASQQPEYNFLRDDAEWARLERAMSEAVLTARVTF